MFDHYHYPPYHLFPLPFSLFPLSFFCPLPILTPLPSILTTERTSGERECFDEKDEEDVELLVAHTDNAILNTAHLLHKYLIERLKNICSLLIPSLTGGEGGSFSLLSEGSNVDEEDEQSLFLGEPCNVRA